MLHSDMGDPPEERPEDYEERYEAREEAARVAFEQLDITWRGGVTWDQVEGWSELADGTYDYFGGFGISLKSERERADEDR